MSNELLTDLSLWKVDMHKIPLHVSDSVTCDYKRSWYQWRWGVRLSVIDMLLSPSFCDMAFVLYPPARQGAREDERMRKDFFGHFHPLFPLSRCWIIKQERRECRRTQMTMHDSFCQRESFCDVPSFSINRRILLLQYLVSLPLLSTSTFIYNRIHSERRETTVTMMLPLAFFMVYCLCLLIP